MMRSRLVGFTLSLILVVVLVGCMGVTGDADPDVETQVQKAEPPNELAATLETEVTGEGVEIEISEDVWLRADGTSRSESELNGTSYVTVNDGEQVWTHEVDKNRVRVHDAEEPFGDRLGAVYEAQREMFDALEVNETTETTIEGHDVYHVVLEPPSNESIGKSIDVTVGETVYAIPVESTDDSASDDGSLLDEEPERLEYWLDTEYLFPVKYQFETDSTVFEMTYTDVEFEPDPPLSDDMFEFDVPENATVEEVDLPDRRAYEDLEEAEAAVGFDLTEPSIPDGYEREQISVATYEEDDRTQVMLSYADGDDGHITIEFTDDPERVQRDGEPVDIGTVTGTYDRLETPAVDVHNVAWTCDDVGYYVGTTVDVDRETLLEIGAEIGCP